jgi:hypothetical protein
MCSAVEEGYKLRRVNLDTQRQVAEILWLQFNRNCGSNTILPTTSVVQTQVYVQPVWFKHNFTYNQCGSSTILRTTKSILPATANITFLQLKWLHITYKNSLSTSQRT